MVANSTPDLSKWTAVACLLYLQRYRRHSAAVSLVSAGVDVTVIRNWLSHASLDTTNLYAQANLATKCAALELVEPPASRPLRWRRDPGLLEWLDSL